MLRSIILASAYVASASIAIAEPTLVSSIPNLPGVESLLHDPDRGVFYATLQAGSEPGDGSVVKIGVDGTIGDVLAAGLENPKGMGLVNGHLFVGDMEHIVEVDVASGEITKHAASGAEFLNDVAVAPNGDVFVSDMFTSAIYRVSDGEVSLWMQGPELENPNGLLFDNGDLFVAAWGPFDDGNPIEAPFGRVLRIDPESQDVSQVTSEPLGNLDGLQLGRDGDLIVTDWKQGAVFSVSRDGAAQQIIDLPRGAGDALYDIDTDRLYVPMALEGEILVFSLN